MTNRARNSSLQIVWGGLFALIGAQAIGQSPFDPPAAQVLPEARALVQGMIDNPRGPYSRLRWYCNDGTVQPPTAFACREHGGGHQHAEFSSERQRLAELGWSIGTIFAALTWEELWDAERRHQRLRELSLERYLIDVADGWVLSEARGYRGRVQVEDEELFGRELLLRMLADPAWLADNYFLARESARVIPHSGGADDRTRATRRAAIELADLDPGFERLRIEIHTTPTATTAGRVRAWAGQRAGDLRGRAALLAEDLDALYGSSGRRERLSAQRTLLGARREVASLAALLDLETAATANDRLAALTDLLREARLKILSPITAANRLLLFDVIAEVDSEVGVEIAEILGREDLSRAELLALGRHLIDATYGTGFLSAGEYAALAQRQVDLDTQFVDFDAYRRAVSGFRLLPQWAVGTVRYTFVEPLNRYVALEPRAAAFIDDLLRSSSLSGMAEITRRLTRDVASLTGVTQSVNGREGVAAFGLNPGVTAGPLRVFATYEELEHGVYDRGDIVVLPETVAELSRVAGIVTLGEGNPLSHVQLLARNFGIPNIAIGPEVLASIRPLTGTEVLAAVGGDGSVILTPAERVDPLIRAGLRPANEVGGSLTVPRPDLSLRRPVPLAELNAGLSGRIVGPKAANLGELARLFPGRVAPAVAVPFGIFAEYMESGVPSLRERLTAAYAQARADEISEAELLGRLAAIRRDIAALTLSEHHRTELVAAMDAEFGDAENLGLFLRSDTNVEDLPQFTGAGLSETLPNVTGLDRQLGTIPRIWASVLSPRAIAWRSNLLTNPEEVYASVLLMQSVPSEKSGVMVTTDLSGYGSGLTISAGWGVGGAVAGEAVESVLLRPDGGETLISEAKTAYQRQLDPSGGIRWIPAPSGAVLTDDDKRQLRELADEVDSRYAAVFDEEGRKRPWDIEFGFVGGELTLFQIRPLVERGPQLADRVVAALSPRETRSLPARVSLGLPPILE